MSSQITLKNKPTGDATFGTKGQDSKTLAKLATRIAVEEKSLDVRAIDLSGQTDVSECFVIASGTSDRHSKNIADKIRLAFKEVGETPIGNANSLKQSREKTDWIILDYGNIVIHVFYEPTRQFYKLDELWKDAAEIPLEPETEKLAKELRTGIYSGF